MADRNALKRAAHKLNGSFYILPSSIHELILVPEVTFGDPAGFNQTVRAVNREAVRPEERLSDHVYRYDADSGELKMILDREEDYDE